MRRRVSPPAARATHLSEADERGARDAALGDGAGETRKLALNEDAQKAKLGLLADKMIAQPQTMRGDPLYTG
jgi:hypothetical protein